MSAKKRPNSEGNKVRVFLAGEGPNELGSRAGHRSFQSDDKPGVLATLLSKVQPSGWEIGGARDWKSIRKLRLGQATHKDTHNVLGAALDAKEAGCDVLAFTRDRDKDPERKEAVEEGIRQIPSVLSSGAPDAIGGVAIPTLEGWILALFGVNGTEAMTPKRAAEELAARGVPLKDGSAMVRAIETADLSRITSDASSLVAWLNRATDVMPRKVAERGHETAS